MVSFTEQWEELLKKEKRKVEEKLQELKKQDIVVEEIEQETKTQDTVVEEEIKISSELIDCNSKEIQDSLNIITKKNKNIDVLELVEIVENEKGPPNEEEKENNKNYILYDFNLRENYSTVETVIYCFFKRQYKISKLRDKDNKKYFSLTIEEIAKTTRESKATVKRAIKKLVDNGHIEIKKGGINKNKYYIK